MKQFYVLILLLPYNILFAQKIEGFYDANFNPTDYVGRYYVVTENNGGRWYREAYYWPEKTQALAGWYLDEKCTKPDGEIVWFHPNKMIWSRILYVNGKKDGLSIRYHKNGMVQDSCHYVAGRQKGIGLGWNSDGYLTDSSNYDGLGNGTVVNWFPGGQVSSAGRYKNDTTKINRWTYYHSSGKVLAYEDYDEGKKTSCSCFDETGKQLDSLLCSREEEANFPGDDKGWIKFLQKNLNPEVPIKKRAPVGLYTVIIQFVVTSDGLITDITPLTSYGYGMEEEVIRILKKSPRWNPAFQFGRHVKAYRKQPVTFMVANE